MDLLTIEEKQRILYEFNNTKTEYPMDKTIVELFEEQVERVPDQIAVMSEGEEITYSQLNNRANQLGRIIRNQGVRPDEFVGIMANRRISTIIGILAILKAGAAYLPLDPKNPQERINYILSDSHCRVLLSEHPADEPAIDSTVKLISIGDSVNEGNHDEVNLEHINASSSDLAYLIYTSGTTGEPKGVMIEHKSVIRLVKNTNYIDFSAVRILQTGSLTFDASTFEIWGALLNGGALCISDEDVLMDVKQLEAAIKKYEVNTMFLTTALFNQLISLNDKIFDGLTQLLFGGEATSEEHVRKLRESNKNIYFANVYGPTESTTFTTYYEIASEQLPDKTPIGKPISNTTVYILDGKALSGIGMPGELCIGGDGLSRGYLNSSQLTDEKYIDNPYIEGEKIYRTGDLARWTEDGNIEYLGRIDSQVKIRGFRIEPGEIESKLREIEGIEEAVVIAREKDGSKYLCGYIVGHEPVEAENIKERLGEVLPDYMVPAHIMVLEQLPLTRNGKLDKKALPVPEMTAAKVYVEPTTDAERSITNSFADILGVGQVGIDDNFFDLGGDSIKAIRIVSQLRKQGYKLSVKEIMKQKTARNIAENIGGKEALQTDTEEVTGNVKLTPIQKTFFQYDLKVPNHFNQSFVLESKERVDEELLKLALGAVAKHHDMLRAVYEGNQQNILPIKQSKLFGLTSFDLTAVEDWDEALKQIDEESEKIQGSIDLAAGPLLQAGLFHTQNGDFIVLCIHHLVVDGVSWRVLIEDLVKSYHDGKDAKEVKLPSKTTSFQKWSEALTTYRDSFLLKREIPYWKGIESKIERAKIRKSADGTETDIDQLSISLTADDTSRLLQQVGKIYNSEINDLLLTALFRAIFKVTGQKVMAVLMEGHGREELDQAIAIDRTVGWFTSTFPVAVEGIGRTLLQDLREVKEMHRRIPNHGIGYGILNELGENVLTGVKPEIVFNYLGEFGQEEAIEGFHIVNIAHGKDTSLENRIDTKISIYGLVTNKEFQLNLIYNKEYYDIAFMEELQMYLEIQLHEILNCQVAEEDNGYTASDLGELSWSDQEFTRVYQDFKENGCEIERIYPLTGLQEGMLYHKLENEEGSSYVIQNVFTILDKPDEQALKESLQLLGEKHAILRTSIVYKNVCEPRQVILKGRELEYRSIDISHEADTESKYKEIRDADIDRGFDLEQDSLFRLTVLKLSEDKYYMIMSFHHCILDGWCMSIVMNDLMYFYDQVYNGNRYEDIVGNIKTGVMFEDYVRYIQGKDQESGRAYWSQLIEGYEEKIGIRPEGRVDAVRDEVGSVKVVLPEAFTNRLEEVGKKNEVTLNTIVEAAWGVLLQKYNNTNDVVFGKIVSGRNAEMKGIEDIVGLFINTVLVRVQTKDRKFSELLADLQQQSITGYQYDYCALNEVKNGLTTGGELFDTLMVFENYHTQEPDPSCKLKLQFMENREQTNYPLTFTTYKHEGLNLDIMYDTSLYGKAEAERITGRLTTILECIAENPEIAIADIEVLSEAEKEQVIYGFNQTKTDYPKDKTIIELFEEQAARTPDNIAVEFNGHTLTYRELNERANYIGGQLRALGAGPDSVIGIMTKKSLEMIVGVYGVLKSGGAYMPIDPEFPIERIKYMFADSGAKLLLTGPGSEEAAAELEGLSIISLTAQTGMTGDNLEHTAKPNHLAYIIYTSGTTGQPKGVMVENRGVVNISTWYQQDKFQEDSVIMQNYKFIFDASVAEIFPAGLTGSKLLILSETQRSDPEELLSLLPGKQLSLIPSMFRVMLEHFELHDNKNVFNEFDKIYLGAEQLPQDLIGKYRDVTGNNLERMYNIYGPTEGTDTVITYDLEGRAGDDIIPIGRPIANMRVYILNGKNICGIGMPGELCFGGDGVSRGYLNNPELTERNFIDNPFIEGEKIYRTGDLARWMADGNIEFLGRIDEQVKIRGFRVELGEIEGKLRMIPTIRDAAVVAKEDGGNKYLCAYVVSHDSMTPGQIKELLSEQLPDYMVPAYIMQLEQLPLNRNGKLDRKALPEPNMEIIQEFVEPRNDAERAVVKAFSEILGLDEIGIDDSFFELGGDSIKAIRIVSKLREYGYKANINNIMKGKIARQISKEIKKMESSDSDYKEVTGTVLLTPIQKEFFSSNYSVPEHYNQSFMLESSEPVDERMLEQALQAIAEHHDMLRAKFEGDHQMILPIKKSSLCVLKCFDYTDYENQEDIHRLITKKSNEIQSSLSLEEGILFKAGLFHTPANDYIMLCIHHLVVDGVSWRIIQEDLVNSYDALKAGNKISLPPKTTSFQKWSETLTKLSKSYVLRKEIPLWKDIEEKVEEGKLKSSADGSLSGIAQLLIDLNEADTNLLLQQAGKAYNTEINDLLLASLFRAIAQVTNQESVAVLLEGHGREQVDESVSVDRTVGWFTTTYPVALRLDGKSIKDDIRQTKETLRRIPNHGIGYGILKELGDNILKGVTPEILFNYLGEFELENADNGFRISHVSTGYDLSEKNELDTQISINGFSNDRKLQLRIVYNQERYSRQFMEEFQACYENQLHQLIEHCLAAETYPTASDFGELAWSDKEFTNIHEGIIKEGYQINRIYPLTGLQEGMLFHKLENEDATSYVLQSVFKMNNDVNHNLLQQSYALLMEKHEVLGTSIVHKNVSEPRQVLLSGRKLEFHIVDFCDKPNAQECFNELKEQDLNRGFDLESDSLVRVTVIRLNETSSFMILTMHHIIVDGWCTSILLNDLLHFYHQLVQGKSYQEIRKELKPGINFEAYVHYIENQDREIGYQYWNELLEGYDEKIGIKPEGKPDVSDYEVETIMTKLTAKQSKKLEAVSRKYEITVNTVLEAAWAILLQKYNHADDIVFGKVVSGRNVDIDGIEEVVGLFINTVPVRAQIDHKRFSDLLAALQQQSIKGNQFDNCPLSDIQNQTALGGNLFDTLMVYENFPSQGESADNVLGLEAQQSREQTNYPLTVYAYMMDSLELGLMYDTEKYGKAEAETIIQRLKDVLLNVIDNPEVEIDKIELLTAQEKEDILLNFNQTQTDYPRNKTIVELFEEQVERVPHKAAVTSMDGEITYLQLNNKANQLGRKLRDSGIQPDDFVGIMAERKISTIIGILGILKAGGAYLPLDPNYPAERTEFIIGDSRCKAILAENPEEPYFAGVTIPVIDLADAALFHDEEMENLEKVNQSSRDLAYLIYTSGTTGEPKGVMIEQQSVSRLVKHTNYADFTDVRILQTGSLTFDASTFEIWGALLNGGKLYIVSEEVLTDVDLLEKTIRQFGVNMMFITTALYNQLISMNEQIFDSLEQLLFGGEATSEEHVRTLWERNQKIRFSNVYGPTESTTFATYYTITGQPLRAKTPIGRPVANTTAYIFSGQTLSGIGIPGELCIGGDGLARGYLNSAKLTKEKFFENPYQAGERLYRTGDLARWTDDGNIEFLGRIDEQVKIRGFRIELKEIESKLKEIETIRDAAVVAREYDGSKYLYGYVVASEAIDSNQIKDSLSKTLPEYMVPAYLIQLEAMPLNKNHKVNKKALPAPKRNPVSEYVLPRNDAEICLKRVFEEVLGVSQAGIDDSFFDLGGDSIKAMRVISKLREYGYQLKVRKLMQEKTIRKIAQAMSDTGILDIDYQEVTGEVELTPIQKEFFRHDLSRPEHFNQSFMLESKEPVDRELLGQALAALAEHHDILRAVYRDSKQVILPVSESPLYELHEFDLTAVATDDELYQRIDEQSNQIQESICLAEGPLLKAGLFHTAEKDYIMLCIHHLVVDGVSWRIIMEDLLKGYKTLREGVRLLLPSKTSSFKRWSQALYEYRSSDLLRQETAYWQELDLLVAAGNLKPDADCSEHGFAELHFSLPAEHTNHLLYKANRAYDTQINDLLIASLSRAIFQLTGQKTVALLMEGHGREEIDKSIVIDRTVGWFTSTYPVVVNPTGESIEADIISVKNTLQKIPNYGIGYGVLKELGEQLLNGNEPSITFNYLGEFDQENHIDEFLISTVPHGHDVSDKNKWDIGISLNSEIINKEFKMSMVYDKEKYSDKLMQLFKSYFEEQLMAVIEACIEMTGKDHSVSTSYDEGDGFNLISFIWSEFGRDSILKSIQVEGMHYSVLFVENLDAGMRHQLREKVMQKTSFESLPHYMLNLNRSKLALPVMEKMKFIEMCNDAGPSDHPVLMAMEAERFTCNFDNEVVHKYKATAMQMYYIATEGKVDAMVPGAFIIEGDYSKEEILKAYRQVIQEQSVFRSSLEICDGDYLVAEHQFDASWYIPYLDLTYADMDYYNDTYAQIKRLYDGDYMTDGVNNMNTLFVTKESERHHIIHYIIHHGLWNKVSDLIIKERFQDILKYHSNKMKIKQTHEQFIEEIKNCVDVSKTIDITKTIDLEEYLAAADEFNKSIAGNEIVTTKVLLLKMGPNVIRLYQNNPWKLIISIVKTIANENGLMHDDTKKIPMFIMSEERRYLAGDYTNTMGLFLDKVPLLVDSRQDIDDCDMGAEIEAILKVKKDYHLNYTELLCDMQDAFYTTSANILTINYHGQYELPYEEVQAYLALGESAPKSDVYVNRYGNHLVMFSPVFRKLADKLEIDPNRTLEGTIQQQLDLLEQRLVDKKHSKAEE